MSLGKVLIFAAGTATGIVVGIASTKSETVRNASKSVIKAGIKAKDWTVDKFGKASDEMKSMVREAKDETAGASIVP